MKFSYAKAYRLLTRIANITFLTEIEICYWKEIMDNIKEWPMGKISYFLLNTAFYAKQYLSGENALIKERINDQINDFKLNYTQWLEDLKNQP